MTKTASHPTRVRLHTRLFCILFVLLGIGWICYVPHHPERMLRMIPHNASLVCMASDLDTAVQQLKNHPALARLEEYERTRMEDISGEAGELGSEVFTSSLNRPEVSKFLKQLAGQECVVAYVSRLSHVPDSITGTVSPQAAWVFYSWVGAKSQAARTILTHQDSSLFEEVTHPYGNVYWHAKQPATTDGRFLSFTLLEGVFIAAFSRDKHAIKYIIQTADLQPGYPTVMMGAPEWDAENIVWPEDQRIDYWMNWQRLRKRGGLSTMIRGTGSSPMQVPVSTDARFVSALNQAVDIDSSLLSDELPMLLGDDPDAVFLYSRDALWKLFGNGGVKPAWLSIPYLELYPSTQASSPVFVAAFSDDLNGRLLDLHVPAVVFGIRLGQPITLGDTAGKVLDGFNKSYQWGVIPVTDGEYVIVEGTRENGYGQQKREHSIAAVVVDDWLLFGTDFTALKKLVVNYTQRKLAGYSDTPDWMPSEKAFIHAGWLNMERGGASLRRAASAYGLTQAGSRQYRATVESIDDLSSIIETASVFQECSYVIRKEEDLCVFSFKTRHPEASH